MAEKPKKKSAAKAEGRPSPTIPEWLTSPDPEAMYQLSFRTDQCDLEPLIDLSRSEFIALKNYLAKMRGYAVHGEAAHA